MFGSGEAVASGITKDWATKARIHRRNQDIWQTIKRLPWTIGAWWKKFRRLPRERGYIYFQEFVPDNAFDTRITVIGSRAFGFRRAVRPGDFRASGSGNIDHNVAAIDPLCVTTAFEVANKIGASCMAFDFIVRKGEAIPLLVEMSFAFQAEAVAGCSGFWTPNLQWHDTPIRPEDAILECVMDRLS